MKQFQRPVRLAFSLQRAAARPADCTSGRYLHNALHQVIPKAWHCYGMLRRQALARVKEHGMVRHEVAQMMQVVLLHRGIFISRSLLGMTFCTGGAAIAIVARHDGFGMFGRLFYVPSS